VSTPAYHAARGRAARSAPSDDRFALVTGADRANWLQGLATNDVLALGPGEGCYAAFLTPQGRMLTDARILHLGDAFLLALPSATADSVLARLDQCIVMEDVALAEVPGPVAGLAIHGPEAAARLAHALRAAAAAGVLEALPEHHAVLVGDGAAGAIATAASLPSDSPHAALVIATRGFGLPGFEVMAARDGLAAIDEALDRDGVPVLDAEDATALRIEAGRPLFGADLTTDTIPLEAGIEDRAISFTKGCYVGQEVIVRVRDRGHGRVARRLVALGARDSDPAASLEPGDSLRRDGRDTGRVTSAAWSPALTEWIGLGYVSREDAGPGTVVTAERDGVRLDLQVRSHPLVSERERGKR
jgi:folate-binding protein YgfZ